MSEKLNRVLTEIDRVNAQDPNRWELDGTAQPKEVAHSILISRWLKKLDPAASEELQIAARGQHISRWEIPRNSYPMDRSGYLRWREDLKKRHIIRVSEIMLREDYSEEKILRTTEIMSKKKIKEDADSQTLEDALCLVFFEMQFEELVQKTDAEKMQVIVEKTWKKLSDRGKEFAKEIIGNNPES